MALAPAKPILPTDAELDEVAGGFISVLVALLGCPNPGGPPPDDTGHHPISPAPL
jgi:hypothetical protein